jgi:hypothetical protein
LYKEFLFPRHKAIIEFLRNHGVKVIELDSDGNVEPLIPFLIEAGVNCLWPLEAASDMDPVSIRKKYGKRLALMGGIDKRELAKDMISIKNELRRKVIPMLDSGGYIPTVDHTYAASWGSASLPIFYLIIYRSYYVHSPFAWSYKVNDTPLALMVPTWMAPRYDSPAYNLRTFFQPAFVVPLLLYLAWFAITVLSDLAISTFTANVLVEKMDFPFPAAAIDTSMATFVAEREPSVARYFLVPFVFGSAFGMIVYLPYVIFQRAFIPIPFVDFTSWMQEVLPGSVLALPTTLSSYVGGMILDAKVGIWMFISSAIIWIILNSLFVTTFKNYAPEWASEYLKGMGLMAITNRSMLRLWFGPQLGFTLAIIAFVIFKLRKGLVSALRTALSKDRTSSLLMSPKKSLLLFVIGSLLSVLLYNMMVPMVPIWVPVFYTFVMGGLMGLMSAASLGMIAYSIPQFTFAWHSLVYLTTPLQLYQAYAFDPPRGGGSTAGFCQQVKASLIVGAHPRDLIKIWIIGSLLAQFVGLIAVDFFWRVAPIPSAAYPMTVYNAISSAYIDSMLTTRMVTINFNTVVIPAIILTTLLFIGGYLESKGAFFSLMGLTVGLFTTPYAVFGLLVGSLVGSYIMPRYLGGKENWSRIRGYVIAGEVTGEGLAMALGTGWSILSKSAWIWPW